MPVFGCHPSKSFRPSQVRAARAALGLSGADLAAEAEVGTATLTRFETGDEAAPNATLDVARRLRAACERLGAEFVDVDDGGRGGWGVLFRADDAGETMRRFSGRKGMGRKGVLGLAGASALALLVGAGLLSGGGEDGGRVAAEAPPAAVRAAAAEPSAAPARAAEAPARAADAPRGPLAPDDAAPRAPGALEEMARLQTEIRLAKLKTEKAMIEADLARASGLLPRLVSDAAPAPASELGRSDPPGFPFAPPPVPQAAPGGAAGPRPEHPFLAPHCQTLERKAVEALVGVSAAGSREEAGEYTKLFEALRTASQVGGCDSAGLYARAWASLDVRSYVDGHVRRNLSVNLSPVGECIVSGVLGAYRMNPADVVRSGTPRPDAFSEKGWEEFVAAYKASGIASAARDRGHETEAVLTGEPTMVVGEGLHTAIFPFRMTFRSPDGTSRQHLKALARARKVGEVSCAIEQVVVQ